LLKVYSLILKQGILAQTLRNAEDSSHRMYARWQYRQNSLYFSLLAGKLPRRRVSVDCIRHQAVPSNRVISSQVQMGRLCRGLRWANFREKRRKLLQR